MLEVRCCPVSPVTPNVALRPWLVAVLLAGLAGHAALAQEATPEPDRVPSPSRVTLSTAGLAEYVFAFPVENEATVRLALETGLSQSFGVYPALSMRAAYAPPLSEAAHDPECDCREAEAPGQGRLQGPTLRSDAHLTGGL